MTKILLTILLLALTSFSQLPNLTKFEYVGKAGKVGAFAEYGTRNADYVVFRGLISPLIDEQKLLIDPDNFSITRIRASCTTYSFAFLSTQGKIDGMFFDQTLEANTNVAPEKSIIKLAIEKMCKRDIKELPKGKDGF